MRKIVIPILSLFINFLLLIILSSFFGSNIETIILIGVLLICANLWAVAEHLKN